MCRCRYFAQRDLWAFVAALFTLWDTKDIDGGKLKALGNVEPSATAKPDKIFRVKLRRTAIYLSESRQMFGSLKTEVERGRVTLQTPHLNL